MGEGMDLVRAALQDGVIGGDYLTWLWFKAETSDFTFVTEEQETFNVFLDSRVTVSGGEGELAESATVSGSSGEFAEARMGLSKGKRVASVKLRIEEDGNIWQVSLRADDLMLQGLKTPKIEAKREGDEDPDGAFLEKCYLVERGLYFLDTLFAWFIKLRLDRQAWHEEVKAYQKWLNAGVVE